MYAFIIGFAILGWFRIIKSQTKENKTLAFFKKFRQSAKSDTNTEFQNSFPFCSIIIAARNEEQNIKQTIHSLLSQQYPSDCFEIIIVDDHSTDKTLQQVQNIANTHSQLKVLSAPTDFCGKKQALQFGLEHAQGDLLFFTDADCILNEHWIETYVSFIKEHQGNLFFGNVIPTISSQSSLLEKCFALDFIGILSVQNGLALNGHPFSCNGANMCITRNFFNEAYETNSNFSSGDDVFLLHKAKQIDSSKIFFINDKNAAVETFIPNTLQSFIQQRCRWASKSTGYKDFESLFIASIVYLLCFSLFSSSILSLLGNETAIHLFWRLLLYKTSLDMCLFLQTAKEYKSLSYILLAIPLQFLYFIYITLIPIISTIKSIEWKGRKIQ